MPTKLSLSLLLMALTFIVAVPLIDAQASISRAGASSNTGVSGSNGYRYIPNIYNFAGYLKRFNKNYGPLEAISRAKIFLAKTSRIFQHNVKYYTSERSYFLNQNEFTDLSSEEVALNYMMPADESGFGQVQEALISPELPADNIDEIESKHSRHISSGKSKSPAPSEEAKAIKPTLTIIEDYFAIDDKNKLVNKPKKSYRNSSKQSKGIGAEAVANKKQMINIMEDHFAVEGSKHIPQKECDLNSVDNETNINNQDKDTETSEEKENVIVKRSIVKTNNIHYDIMNIDSAHTFSYKDELLDKGYQYNTLDGDGYDDEDDYFMVNAATLDQEPLPSAENGQQSNSYLSSFLKPMKFVYGVLTATSKQDEPKDIHYDIDWRKTGCITQPKSQMICKSCYAFSTLSMLEYLYCNQTKELTDFSAQYVLDCGFHANLNGCKGGQPSRVGKFVMQYGIELNALYPYKGVVNKCEVSEKVPLKNNGYLRANIKAWQRFTRMRDWFRWIKRSPIMVGVRMPSNFLEYGGGIHDGFNCMTNVTHAMLLVGSGSQKGKDFWLLKNSFGVNWGEQGYFRLSKSAPMKCFEAAIVARAEF